MNVLLLHNRTAGDQEPSPGRLLTLLRRAGYEPRYFDLHPALKDPTTLPAASMVVVAGGDGSVREAALKLAGRGMPLAVLPLGTANNIARSLGIAGSPAEIIDSWHHGRNVRFDIGKASGPWGEERFVEGVGVGLFARIIDILGRMEVPKAHEDAERPHRVASDLRSTTVLAHEMAPVLVEMNCEGEHTTGQYLLLEIMNIGRVGAGIELAEADVSDRQLDVVSAQLDDREKLLESLRDVAKGAPTPARLASRRCPTIELILPPCEFRIDDRVQLIPNPARVRVGFSQETVEFVVPADRS